MVRVIKLENIIKKAKNIHGDKYKYKELIKLENGRWAIKYICSSCDDNIIQEVRNHIQRKCGCPTCYKKSVIDLDMIKTKGYEIYGNKYIYLECLKDGKNVNVKFKCLICNHINTQRYNNHLKVNGSECIKCVRKNTGIKNRMGLNYFIKKCKKIHGDFLYDYSYINKHKFKTVKDEINIFCNKCENFFQQKMDIHLKGCGCSRCNSSFGENNIRLYLQNNNIKFEEQHKFKNQKKYIGNCEYDFYIPSKNLIIEYHGRQHFYYNEFFHNDFFDFLDLVNRDFEKMKFCKENNINFIEIHYNQNIDEILEEYFGK